MTLLLSARPILSPVVILWLVAGTNVECVKGDSVVHNINDFSCTLYQVLSGEPGNLAVSPLGVEAALLMVWLGAGGRTSRMLAAALHVSSRDANFTPAFKAQLSTIQRKQNIDIANKVYVSQGLQVSREFQKIAHGFLAETGEVDFADIAAINGWVNNSTHHKIKDMIPLNTLDSETKMLLVSAAYTGGWLKNFEGGKELKMAFTVNSSMTVQINVLYSNGLFSYKWIPNLQAQAIRVPYGGGAKLSMLLLLPDETDGIGRLESRVATLKLPGLLSSLERVEVMVFVPRFKVEKTSNLKHALELLDMSDIFSPDADFNVISDGGAHFSHVLHKALVEVSDQQKQDNRSQVIYLKEGVPLLFKADHPFLFLILDDTTEAILFMGRVVNPVMPNKRL